jgi:hypothetical protein
MSCKDVGLIAGLMPSIDDILGIRDALGAVIDPVYFVTRTWASGEIGEGSAVDTLEQMLPSPELKNYSQDLRLREGAMVKQGDIILRNVSRNKYTEDQLDGSTIGVNVERLYLVGDKLYQVINIMKKYVTWDVQLRELSNQRRYSV